MKTIFRNTIFTNVASTSDGGVFWEGMEDELAPGVTVTDWLGRPWNGKMPAAHPNSRYSTWQKLLHDDPEDGGWDVTLCLWVKIIQGQAVQEEWPHRTQTVCVTLKMEAQRSFETLETTHLTTQRHIPEDLQVHLHTYTALCRTVNTTHVNTITQS